MDFYRALFAQKTHWPFEGILWWKGEGGGGSSVTVSGLAPLVLSNVKGKSLTHLVQYGICAASGTPAPTAPVDISMNNGTLKVVDDELPSEYKRVLGFSMNNNSYWEIPNFPLYGSDTLRFSFEASEACNILGAYSGSASGNNYSYYVSTSTVSYLRYKSSAYNSTIDANTRYDAEITPTGSHGMKVNSTWTAQTFTTPTNLCIGTTAVDASSAKTKGKIYGNVEVVGRAKFIPCERVSDSTLGYYDVVSETFYEQASNYHGAVSLGYDGSHYSLSVIGSPETITVRGNNLFDASVVEEENKYINANTGKPTSPSSGTFRYSDYIPVIAGTTYFFGITPFAASAAGMAWYSDIDTYISGHSGTWLDNNNMRDTAPTNAKYVRFSIRIDEGYDTNWQNTVFMGVYGTINSYKPYREQTAHAEDLYAVGDYEDTQDIVTGAVVRNVGIYIFDGTETWIDGNYGYITEAVQDQSGDTYTALCTHYRGTTGTPQGDSNTFRCYRTSQDIGRIYIAPNRTTYDTKEAFAAYVAEQYAAGTPIIVLYPLLETKTESTTPQHIELDSGTNIVDVKTDADLQIKFDATYIASSP